MRSMKRYDVASLPTNVSAPLQLIIPARVMREPFHWPVRSIVTVIFGFAPLTVPLHRPARLSSGAVAAEAVGAKAAIARMIVMARRLDCFMAGIVRGRPTARLRTNVDLAAAAHTSIARGANYCLVIGAEGRDFQALIICCFAHQKMRRYVPPQHETPLLMPLFVASGLE